MNAKRHRVTKTRQRRKRVSTARLRAKRKPGLVPEKVLNKVERVQNGPMLMRFVNSGELFEAIAKGKIPGVEAVKTDSSLQKIVQDATRRGWGGYSTSQTNWDANAVRLRFEDSASLSLKRNLKRFADKREAFVSFQKELLESVSQSSEANDFRNLADIAEFQFGYYGQSIFEDVFRGNWRTFKEKLFATGNPRAKRELSNQIRRYSAFFRDFGRKISPSEFKIMMGLLFDPEFIAKNPRRLNSIIRTCSKLSMLRLKPESGPDKISQYNLLLLVDPFVPHKNLAVAGMNWVQTNPISAENILGVVVLTRTTKDAVGKILTATSEKQELRMPIFDRRGRQIWPPKKVTEGTRK